MRLSLWHELRGRRFSIRSRWEALLRAEPVATPLGNPDALVHLIDPTMDELLAILEGQPRAPALAPARDDRAEKPHCPCGRNPLLAYFAAARQAMLEGLILAQASSAPLDPVERDTSIDELNAALDSLSRRDIEAFCGICQFRHLALPAPVQSLAICGG